MLEDTDDLRHQVAELASVSRWVCRSGSVSLLELAYEWALACREGAVLGWVLVWERVLLPRPPQRLRREGFWATPRTPNLDTPRRFDTPPFRWGLYRSPLTAFVCNSGELYRLHSDRTFGKDRAPRVDAPPLRWPDAPYPLIPSTGGQLPQLAHQNRIDSSSRRTKCLIRQIRASARRV